MHIKWSTSDLGVYMWDGIERRKGADWIDVGINIFNILAWIVFVVALIIFDRARPEQDYFVYQMIGEPVEVRTYWLEELKNWLLVSLYVCTLISVVTLVMNSMRLKRRDDRQRYGMYMLVSICIAFIAVLLLQ